MVAFNKFNTLAADLPGKVHNFGVDTLKLMLSNVAPTAANAVKADITEIAAGNGYSAGGTAITITQSSQSGGTYKLVGNNVTFTASGGSIATFRYVIIYNSSPGAGPLIGFWDSGGAQVIVNGNSFTAALDQTNGILQIA